MGTFLSYLKYQNGLDIESTHSPEKVNSAQSGVFPTFEIDQEISPKFVKNRSILPKIRVILAIFGHLLKTYDKN